MITMRLFTQLTMLTVNSKTPMQTPAKADRIMTIFILPEMVASKDGVETPYELVGLVVGILP